jgi:ribosomal protein S10
VSIKLTTGQQFELERFSRAIDATSDLQQLQSLAKKLLVAWQVQVAATRWVIKQELGR